MKAPFKRLDKIIYGGVFLVLVVSLWIVLKTKPVEVEAVSVKKGSFIETFAIDGKIRSKNKTTVVAFANGDIDEIKLKAGDTIRKDDTITVLRWDYVKKIISPMNGVVVKVYRETAGPITRGEPLIDIIDPNNLEIVAEPLTSDSLRITENTPVEISGLKEGLIFTAKVTNISKAGFIKISALGVEEERTEVRMDFVNVPQEILDRLGDNFHVELEMKLSIEENVLKVPLGSLFKDGEKWSVYVIKDKKARTKNIEIAKRNNEEALVTRGLVEGETVILFPGDAVSEGTSVKIKNFKKQ